jgi:hypothetical protein
VNVFINQFRQTTCRRRAAAVLPIHSLGEVTALILPHRAGKKRPVPAGSAPGAATLATLQ